MRRLALLTLLVLTPALFAASPRNPWAGHKPGSFVRTKTVTVVTVGTHKVQTVTDITQSVVEVKGEQAVVETTASMNGVPRPTRTRSEVSLKEAAPAPGAVRKSGSESLNVAGQTIRCEWTELETDMAGNRTTVKTWTSPQVPGGVVKTVSKNTLMESTLEVVAFGVK